MFRVTRVFTALAVTVALALAGLSAAPAQAEAAAKCTVSKSEYKKITKCYGKRSAYEGQSQTPKIKLSVYRTPGGHYVFIDFKSGRVLSKSRMSNECWPWSC